MLNTFLFICTKYKYSYLSCKFVSILIVVWEFLYEILQLLLEVKTRANAMFHFCVVCLDSVLLLSQLAVRFAHWLFIRLRLKIAFKVQISVCVRQASDHRVSETSIPSHLCAALGWISSSLKVTTKFRETGHQKGYDCEVVGERRHRTGHNCSR